MLQSDMDMLSMVQAAEVAQVHPSSLRRAIVDLIHKQALCTPDYEVRGRDGYFVSATWLRGWLACKARSPQAKGRPKGSKNIKREEG